MKSIEDAFFIYYCVKIKHINSFYDTIMSKYDGGFIWDSY